MLIALVVALCVAPVLWAIFTYNQLVAGQNETSNAWAQIEVQLKRRHDLIPNLVEAVRGYMQHEAATLEAVITARSAAVGARTVGQAAQAESGVMAALSGLFAVAERYPDLKANQNFLALQEELTTTENRIGFARQAYNDTVMRFNVLREVFPNSLIASSFVRPQLFEIGDAGDRATPKVQFEAA